MVQLPHADGEELLLPHFLSQLLSVAFLHQYIVVCVSWAASIKCFPSIFNTTLQKEPDISLFFIIFLNSNIVKDEDTVAVIAGSV